MSEDTARPQPNDGQSDKRVSLTGEIRELEADVQNLRIRIRGLYEDLVRDVIDKDEYFQFKSRYEEKAAEVENRITDLKAESNAIEQEAKRQSGLAKDAEMLARDPEMAVSMIDRLVERVEVTHDKEVRITFRF